MPKGNNKGFSDIINEYDNPKKVLELYSEVYLSSNLGIEALIEWEVAEDRNVQTTRKEPIEYTAVNADDETAFDAMKNKLIYTQPKYKTEYFTLDKSITFARQYPTLDIHKAQLIDKEIKEASNIEKSLRRQAIIEELQNNALKFEMKKSSAYDIWQLIFETSRKLNMNTRNLTVIVPDSIMLEWRKDKLFDNDLIKPLVSTELEDNPVELDGMFTDKISGVTFVSVPDTYTFTTEKGQAIYKESFKKNVKAVFWENDPQLEVLKGYTMDHTPLQIGKAAPGSGYGNVYFMERIGYFGAALLDPNRSGVISFKEETPTPSKQVNDNINNEPIEVNETDKRTDSKLINMGKLSKELNITGKEAKKLLDKNNNDYEAAKQEYLNNQK